MEFGVKMGMTQEQYDTMKKSSAETIVLMTRYAEPEEMAKTILFMATDTTYMTGAKIVADGGYVLFAPRPKLE
uniref:Uncharacterized protein n=1 Tax=Acrobeloides nanus TaxID=290746 RepID=A0A914DZW2_9BILA